MKLSDTALGASLAGIAQLDQAVRERIELPTAVDPSQTFTAVLVLALAHGEDQPELDWWGGPGGTEGNRRLQEMSAAIRRTLAERVWRPLALPALPSLDGRHPAQERRRAGRAGCDRGQQPVDHAAGWAARAAAGVVAGAWIPGTRLIRFPSGKKPISRLLIPCKGCDQALLAGMSPGRLCLGRV